MVVMADKKKGTCDSKLKTCFEMGRKHCEKMISAGYQLFLLPTVLQKSLVILGGLEYLKLWILWPIISFYYPKLFKKNFICF